MIDGIYETGSVGVFIY